MAYQLTEDNIKHATLSFLKTYYKNNSSRGFGNTVATIDMQAGDGIIADGYLKFSVDHNPTEGMSAKEAEKIILNTKSDNQTKEKETFLATFEATSQHTASEIQYRVQRSLLIFDALAISSMVAAASYGYNFMNDQFTLNQLGTFKFFAGFFGVMLASMVGYMLIFKNLSRYHHIYALAQFKRYHADEQWVSYGEDVFANPDNKYLLELKKQCIRQGFGLISVDKSLNPSLVITPARDSELSTSNRIKHFFKEKTAKNKAFKWVNGIKMPSFKSPINTSDYTRYTKSYWKQTAVILAMLFVMGEIYLEELKNPNIVYLDEATYQAQLKKIVDNKIVEPVDFLEDEFIPESQQHEDKTKSTKKSTTANQKVALPPKPKSLRAKKDAIIISTGFEKYVSYDCSRLSAMDGNNFLVQIETAYSSAEAIRKVQYFNKNGFKANAIWLGCFINKRFYVVYLDDIFDNKNAATQRLEKYQKLLIAKKQNPKDAILRAIEIR